MNKIEILKQICENEVLLISLNEDLDDSKSSKKEKALTEVFKTFFEQKDKEIFNNIYNSWDTLEKNKKTFNNNWTSDIMHGNCGDSTYLLIYEMISCSADGSNYSEASNDQEDLQKDLEIEYNKDFTFDYLSPCIESFLRWDWGDLYNPIQNSLRIFMQEYKQEYNKLKSQHGTIDIKKEKATKEKQLLKRIRLYKNFNLELSKELEKCL